MEERRKKVGRREGVDKVESKEREREGERRKERGAKGEKLIGHEKH